MKVCTQCKIEKEGYHFPKRISNKDGLYSWCKECCKEKTKAHALKNPEAVKRSREKRKDRALFLAREYKKKHKVRLEAQRKVHYILNRDEICEKQKKYHQKKTEEQKKKKHEYYQKWSKTENAKKYRVSRKKVYIALKNGKLIKPNKCTLCFSDGKVEAHHPDYEKPLEVVWLCKSCHGKVHRK